MTVPAKRAIDHVKQTNVSEATRRDARPAAHEVRTFAQEFDDLKLKKKELEAELADLGQSFQLKEQSRIRRESRGDFESWIRRKSEIADLRSSRVKRLLAIETRMTFIRERAREENKVAWNASNASRKKPELAPLLEELIFEVREISKLLRELSESRCHQ